MEINSNVSDKSNKIYPDGYPVSKALFKAVLEQSDPLAPYMFKAFSWRQRVVHPEWPARNNIDNLNTYCSTTLHKDLGNLVFSFDPAGRHGLFVADRSHPNIGSGPVRLGDEIFQAILMDDQQRLPFFQFFMPVLWEYDICQVQTYGIRKWGGYRVPDFIPKNFNGWWKLVWGSIMALYYGFFKIKRIMIGLFSILFAYFILSWICFFIPIPTILWGWIQRSWSFITFHKDPGYFSWLLPDNISDHIFILNFLILCIVISICSALIYYAIQDTRNTIDREGRQLNASAAYFRHTYNRTFGWINQNRLLTGTAIAFSAFGMFAAYRAFKINQKKILLSKLLKGTPLENGVASKHRQVWEQALDYWSERSATLHKIVAFSIALGSTLACLKYFGQLSRDLLSIRSFLGVASPAAHKFIDNLYEGCKDTAVKFKEFVSAHSYIAAGTVALAMVAIVNHFGWHRELTMFNEGQDLSIEEIRDDPIIMAKLMIPQDFQGKGDSKGKNKHGRGAEKASASVVLKKNNSRRRVDNNTKIYEDAYQLLMKLLDDEDQEIRFRYRNSDDSVHTYQYDKKMLAHDDLDSILNAIYGDEEGVDYRQLELLNPYSSSEMQFLQLRGRDIQPAVLRSKNDDSGSHYTTLKRGEDYHHDKRDEPEKWYTNLQGSVSQQKTQRKRGGRGPNKGKQEKPVQASPQQMAEQPKKKGYLVQAIEEMNKNQKILSDKVEKLTIKHEGVEDVSIFMSESVPIPKMIMDTEAAKMVSDAIEYEISDFEVPKFAVTGEEFISINRAMDKGVDIRLSNLAVVEFFSNTNQHAGWGALTINGILTPLHVVSGADNLIKATKFHVYGQDFNMPKTKGIKVIQGYDLALVQIPAILSSKNMAKFTIMSQSHVLNDYPILFMLIERDGQFYNVYSHGLKRDDKLITKFITKSGDSGMPIWDSKGNLVALHSGVVKYKTGKEFFGVATLIPDFVKQSNQAEWFVEKLNLSKN